MLDELRQRVCRANLDLVAAGLVTLTWGNVSGIDRESGRVVIKPSGVDYEKLTPENMAVVDLDGAIVAGDLRPSSDTPTHLELYRSWPDVGGIVHTHSLSATAFAQACRPIPPLGTTHADAFFGEVPLTRPLSRDQVRQDYEINTGKVIVERFAELDVGAVPAVLVANHGPFTWGQSPAAAVKMAVILEQVARMALQTLQIRSETPPLAQHILAKHYTRKHGPDAYYGQK